MRFLKIFYLVTISIILFLGSGSTPEKNMQPNVLFISFDDLNDWTGCLSGHPQSITPNINRLADKGILFTNGQEELYDHDRDPEEWKNLADDPEYKTIKEGLSAFIPQNNATPVQGLYAD